MAVTSSSSRRCTILYWTSIAAASYAQQQQQAQDSSLSRFLTTLRLINFLVIGHGASLLSHHCSRLRSVFYLSFVRCRLVLCEHSCCLRDCLNNVGRLCRYKQNGESKNKGNMQLKLNLLLFICIDVCKGNCAFTNY
jgi:hypothetical protein